MERQYNSNQGYYPPGYPQPRYPPQYGAPPPYWGHYPIPTAPVEPLRPETFPYNMGVNYPPVLTPADFHQVKYQQQKDRELFERERAQMEEADEADREAAVLFGGPPPKPLSVWGFSDQEFDWGKFSVADLAYYANTLGGSSLKVTGIPQATNIRALKEAHQQKLFDVGELFSRIGKPHERVAVATPFNVEPYLAKVSSFTLKPSDELRTVLSFELDNKPIDIAFRDGFALSLPPAENVTLTPYNEIACDVASDLSVPVFITNGKVKSNTPDTVVADLEKYNSRGYATLAAEQIRKLDIPSTTLKGPELASFIYQQIYTKPDNRGVAGRLAISMPGVYAKGTGDIRQGRLKRARVIPGVRFSSDTALYKFQSQMSTLLGGFGNSGGQWADIHADGVSLVPNRRVFVNLIRDMFNLPYKKLDLYAINTKDREKAIYIHMNLTQWRKTWVDKMDKDERTAYLDQYILQDPLYNSASEEAKATWVPRIPPIVVLYQSESSPSSTSVIASVMANGGVAALYEFANLAGYVYVEPIGHNSPTTDKSEEVSIENFSQSVTGMCDRIKRLKPVEFLLVVPSIYSRGSIKELSDYNPFFTMSANGHRNQFLLTSYDTGRTIDRAGLHTVVRYQMLFGNSYRYSRLTWNHHLTQLWKGLDAKGTQEHVDIEGASETAKQVMKRIAAEPGRFFRRTPDPRFYTITKASVDQFGYEISPEMLLDDEAFTLAEAEFQGAVRSAERLESIKPATEGEAAVAKIALRDFPAGGLGGVKEDKNFDMNTLPDDPDDNND